MFKNKKIWIGIGVIVLIGLLVGINIWKQSDENATTVKTVSISEEAMTETVMMPGILELADEQNVYFEAEQGEIDKVLVKEGDEIEKGTEIIRYQNEQLTLEKKENELGEQANHLELNNLTKQHQEIDKQLEDDPDNEALQKEHDQIKFQQQQAIIEVERGNLQKESTKKEMNAQTITSEVEGTVVTVNDAETLSGEQLEEEPLVRIGSLNNLIVKGSVSEFDTLEIAEEQEVTLTSEAVPDKEWKGTVTLISYLPETSEGMEGENGEAGKQYNVEVSVEDEIDLKPGFQMLAEIETSSKETKTLPVKAVKQDGDEDYVYLVEDGKAVKQNVSVGAVTSEKVEIKEGLTADDEVIHNPSDQVSGGMDVTVK